MSEPPVPADADLRDFPYVPLFRNRLFASTFHAKASDSEWRAGVTLWLKSWDQQPAGSLPDDDAELCYLADLGRDLRTWRKVRPMALHGWTRCDDGRLYHHTVAEGINSALKIREMRHAQTAAARAARQRNRDRDVTVTDNVAPLSQTPSGSGSRGTESKKGDSVLGRESKDSLPPPPSPPFGGGDARGRARGRARNFKSPRMAQTEGFAYAADQPSRNR